MFLEIIIWVFFYTCFFSFILLLYYWINLFRYKDTYTKEEIFSIVPILKQEYERFFPYSSEASHFLSIGLGIAFAWLLTFLGGILSPDLDNLPDYASSELSNYFFQSFLILILFHITFPAIRDTNFYTKRLVLQKFFRHEFSFLISLSISLASMNIVLWGLYHELLFLYILINVFLCLLYALYRIQLEEEKLIQNKKKEKEPSAELSQTIGYDDIEF